MVQKEQFLKVVADSMEVKEEELSMDTQYKVFPAWDSLKMMTIIMDLEYEFDVSIPMESLGKVKTLGDLYSLLES